MSLELSKEMLTVKGYLGDARVLVEEKLGGGGAPLDIWATLIIEVARMLQVERQHHSHKKPKPEISNPLPPIRNSDSLMSSARKHPKLPPMVSDDEGVQEKPKRSHTRKTPVEVKPLPRRVTPPSEGKTPRDRKSKAEPKQKSSRRR